MFSAAHLSPESIGMADALSRAVRARMERFFFRLGAASASDSMLVRLSLGVVPVAVCLLLSIGLVNLKWEAGAVELWVRVFCLV